MNPIKTKPPDHAPHIKTSAAQAPKELMRRSLLSAREQAQSVAEPQPPQDEQPEQYAEARIEHAAANAAHGIGNETAYRRKRLMLKASRRIKQNRQSQRGTEQSRSSFYSAENNTVQQGREYAKRNNQALRMTAQSATQSIKQNTESSKAAAKGTVKTIRRGVKAAQHTSKQPRGQLKPHSMRQRRRKEPLRLPQRRLKRRDAQRSLPLKPQRQPQKLPQKPLPPLLKLSFRQ